MSRPRIIKKYPNRRLYDTEISSYVTLEDIRQLVQDGEAFEVQDAKTGQHFVAQHRGNPFLPGAGSSARIGPHGEHSYGC